MAMKVSWFFYRTIQITHISATIQHYDKKPLSLDNRFPLYLRSLRSTQFNRTAIMATITKLRQCQPHDWRITTSWPTQRRGNWPGGTYDVIGDNPLLPRLGRGHWLVALWRPCPSPACDSHGLLSLLWTMQRGLPKHFILHKSSHVV